MKLYDVNPLLALWRQDHPAAPAARRWLAGVGPHPWATCELTWSGSVRLSCNPAIFHPPLTAGEAFRLLRQNTAAATHRFLDLKPGDETLFNEIFRRCHGYRQIADAFLIHMAICHNATLATFDAELRHLSLDPDAVEVIPLN